MQPTQQFYFYIVVFPLFYPTPVSSSKIFKTIVKLPNTWPFPGSLRGWCHENLTTQRSVNLLTTLNFGPNL
jgi:hypothetical protein